MLVNKVNSDAMAVASTCGVVDLRACCLDETTLSLGLEYLLIEMDDVRTYSTADVVEIRDSQHPPRECMVRLARQCA
jgi:hypothetical protein